MMMMMALVVNTHSSTSFLLNNQIFPFLHTSTTITCFFFASLFFSFKFIFSSGGQWNGGALLREGGALGNELEGLEEREGERDIHTNPRCAQTYHEA